MVHAPSLSYGSRSGSWPLHLNCSWLTVHLAFWPHLNPLQRRGLLLCGYLRVRLAFWPHPNGEALPYPLQPRAALALAVAQGRGLLLPGYLMVRLAFWPHLNPLQRRGLL